MIVPFRNRDDEGDGASCRMAVIPGGIWRPGLSGQKFGQIVGQ
jgi:hypothetical protein